jgi:hypothetical protein
MFIHRENTQRNARGTKNLPFTTTNNRSRLDEPLLGGAGGHDAEVLSSHGPLGLEVGVENLLVLTVVVHRCLGTRIVVPRVVLRDPLLQRDVTPSDADGNVLARLAHLDGCLCARRCVENVVHVLGLGPLKVETANLASAMK